MGQFKNRLYRKVVPIEYCYTDTPTGINSLLKIKGCYFSDEGTFSCIFFAKNLFALQWIASVYDTLKYKNGEIRYIDDGYTSFYWGAYIIVGDTIKAYCVNDYGMPTHGYSESWFKIINDSTIKYIAADRYRNSPYHIYHPEYFNKVMRFYPMKNIPNPETDAWVMRKEWFWCNDTLYKKWMEKNQKKKNR